MNQSLRKIRRTLVSMFISAAIVTPVTANANARIDNRFSIVSTFFSEKITEMGGISEDHQFFLSKLTLKELAERTSEASPPYSLLSSAYPAEAERARQDYAELELPGVINSTPLALDLFIPPIALVPEFFERWRYESEDQGEKLVEKGLNYLGIRYKWGGTDPKKGFDCSGLVVYVFNEALGLKLPRTSRDIYASGDKVSKDELRPGDLVFFNTRNARYSHVGIHIGEGKFIHAPRSGKRIEIASMDAQYWSKRFNGAVRYHGQEGQES